MDQLLTNNVWRQVSKHLGAGDKKIAAIAYVTDETHLPFRDGDVLICDASDAAIKSGETKAALLKTFLETGVELYSCPGLHAKTLVSDKLAVVGSSNLSASSADRLIEFSLLTHRIEIRSQVRAFVQKLIPISTSIDAAFVSRACELPVSVRRGFSNTLRAEIQQPSNRWWVVSTTPLSEKIREREAEIEAEGSEIATSRMSDPENSLNWIRWVGKGPFRTQAREGDLIIELASNKERTRCRVNQPRSIVHRQVHGSWTRFFFEDPPDGVYFVWSDFLKKLNSVGIRAINQRTTRELKTKEINLMTIIWADD